MNYILGIDQGTTSTRAVLFNDSGIPVHTAQRELSQIFPDDGWVEHDPEEIWSATMAVCKEAVAACQDGVSAITAIGIANQRETSVIWDRVTGTPVYNAIVWQDRRTASVCTTLRDSGYASDIAAKTGLVVDPYFSGTKVAWILDNVMGARERASDGKLAFGTIDTFLLWRLTSGQVHATDATNASRTMLFNIHDQTWDTTLLELLDVPAGLLPDVRDSADDFGETDPVLFGEAIPIRGVVGDQQAGLIGQASFKPGMVKCTFGTGCFAMLNTGSNPLASNHRLLTTVAYRIAGQTTFALEGSIFIAGAAVQWLRDKLKIIDNAAQSEVIARSVSETGGVYMVPAFTGLGAPYWDTEARGVIVGLTRDSGAPEIVRAALESVVYQTRDLFEAMAADGTTPVSVRVDGGMAANDWTMQFLSDLLSLRVERPLNTETTVLGAAYLSALGAGLYGSLDDVAAHWRINKTFSPTMAETDRDRLYAGWLKAVAQTQGR